MNDADEGDDCPDCGKGRMEFAFPGECGCFTCPPCWSCTNSYLECSECGWQPEDEDKMRAIHDKGLDEWANMSPEQQELLSRLAEGIEE
jgi:hypothetical protein